MLIRILTIIYFISVQGLNQAKQDIFRNIKNCYCNMEGLIPLSIVVCYCCCNKLSQILLLKTTEIYYLTIQEVRNQNRSHSAKIKVSAGLHSFWRIHPLPPPVSRGCLHSLAWAASSQSLLPSSHPLL